jgi:alpha-amylase
MAVLADFENRNIRFMKNKRSAKTLRTLPPEEAFHFTSPTGYVGYAAYSLDQFCDLLRVVPSDSIAYHQERGDIAQWIEHTLQDQKLAEDIIGRRDRQDLIITINQRREELWSRLK